MSPDCRRPTPPIDADPKGTVKLEFIVDTFRNQHIPACVGLPGPKEDLVERDSVVPADTQHPSTGFSVCLDRPASTLYVCRHAQRENLGSALSTQRQATMPVLALPTDTDSPHDRDVFETGGLEEAVPIDHVGNVLRHTGHRLAADRDQG